MRRRQTLLAYRLPTESEFENVALNKTIYIYIYRATIEVCIGANKQVGMHICAGSHSIKNVSSDKNIYQFNKNTCDTRFFL